ncbi:MAG: N(4)-(beta-N-acetylglucosaminyl)-L-asparaginase [Bacteroidetes bacterium]|nr:N(4)-(beta-N-acetylglucosaminyl)-L-asparaginase [Bacteroidota bacterium]
MRHGCAASGINQSGGVVSMNTQTRSRRFFLKAASLLGVSAALGPADLLAVPNTASTARWAHKGVRPLSIASANGLESTARAMHLLRDGRDTLDAVIAGVNIVEDDPDDQTVGYGGLPNEDGEVELDSCVMHGPTGRGGGVAALRNIKNPSLVARRVMERSDHVLLVGEGALHFARAHGFREENLLTDAARERWLRWKETLSNEDDWLPPHGFEDRDLGMNHPDMQEESRREAGWRDERARPTGTINCLAVDANGDISGVTTTSGLAFKIPGRVADSPIIGAGLYVDNAVGAAGSTGRGEANLLALSSFLIVERMRMGDHPTDACLHACRRIAEQTKMKRLLDENGRLKFNVNFYALDKDGRHGAASVWPGKQYAVNDGNEKSHLLDCAALYES